MLLFFVIQIHATQVLCLRGFLSVISLAAKTVSTRIATVVFADDVA